MLHPDATLQSTASFGTTNTTVFAENHTLLLNVGDGFLDALFQLAKSKDVKWQYSVMARCEPVRRGGLPALLALAESDDMDALLYAVLTCMRYLSLCICIGAHLVEFAAAREMQFPALI